MKATQNQCVCEYVKVQMHSKRMGETCRKPVTSYPGGVEWTSHGAAGARDW